MQRVSLTRLPEPGDIIHYINLTFQNEYLGIVLGNDPHYESAYEVIMLKLDAKPHFNWHGKVMRDTAFLGNIYCIVDKTQIRN